MARQFGEGVARRIRTEREARQLSVDVLAKNASVPKLLVEQLEQGVLASANLDLLDALAKALEVTVLDLLKDTNAVQSEEQAAAEIAREEAAFYAGLPPSLREFVEEEKAGGRPIAKEALRALAAVEFQQATPSSPDAWRGIFLAMIQGLHPA